MKNSQYYREQLIRPTWAPPAKVFAPVWTFLYVLIAISFIAVFVKGYQRAIPFVVVLPFILNLALNVAYTPIQFGLKNNYLASVDIILILGTLIWMLVAIYPYMKWVAIINIPYLLWVSFATVLQLTITYLNR